MRQAGTNVNREKNTPTSTHTIEIMKYKRIQIEKYTNKCTYNQKQ